MTESSAHCSTHKFGFGPPESAALVAVAFFPCARRVQGCFYRRLRIHVDSIRMRSLNGRMEVEMRKKVVRWAVIVPLAMVSMLLGSTTALAGQVSCSVVIQKIKVIRSSRHVRIYNDSGGYWGLCVLGTDADCAGIMSMAVAAQLSGKTMVVTLNDAQTACDGNSNPADVLEVNLAP
jgi:hypothetical protein